MNNLRALLRDGGRSCALAMLGLRANLAAAQDYPTRPVRLIIPFPPGGSNDVVGRLIATHLGERLGKQVVVDNRSGAGGVIGTEIVAKSPPDGYTLLIISMAHAVNPWLYKLAYDPIKDFAPVGLLAKGPNVLVVHPVAAGQIRQGTDRARQAEARRPAICLRRHRQLPASRRRTVQADGRRRSSCMCRSRAAAPP